jgi:uncharacterized damage-inducible protein DinB
MDLFDLFSGADSWYTRRLLNHAAGLSDDQLDHDLNTTAKVFPWDKPDRSLREILERIVQTTEVWTAALTGGEMPDLDGQPPTARTPAALLARFDKADAQYQAILKAVRDRNGWEETFVDALCEPAETFTYGSMFTHVITFNAHRRLNALDAFQKLGASFRGTGDPGEYETAQKHGLQA